MVALCWCLWVCVCIIEYPAYVGFWGAVPAFWVLRLDCLVCALLAGVRGADAALFLLFPSLP